MVAPPLRRSTPMFDVATAYGLRKRSVAPQRPVTKWPRVHAMITIKSGPDPQLTLRHACDYLNRTKAKSDRAKSDRGDPATVVTRRCFLGNEQQIELRRCIIERTAAQTDDVGQHEAAVAQEAHDAFDFSAAFHGSDRARLDDQRIDVGEPAGH